MVQAKSKLQTTAAQNNLNELGFKIFLDRYAQKDMTRDTLAVGDLVIVVVNGQTGQREIGRITEMALPKVTIELLDGEVVERDIENVDKPLETEPGQMMDRVAAGIAAVEKNTKLKKDWQKKFRWLLDDFKFVPAGRILAAAGTDQELTFYNCYVIPSPKDSRGGIIETLRQMTEIMSRGGGVGINVSSLRPHHAYVKGVNGRSSGAVSWGALYSFVTGLIEQGGCFGPNERIATDKGLIPAAEIADRIDAGEVFHAHTHKGLRRVTARFRNGIKPLYEVTTSRGYRVRITEDHKVAVLMDGKITTMALKYLQEGDEILLLLGKGAQTGYVPLQQHQYERSIMSTTLNTDVRTPDILDEDLAYLVGYMHGDGYVHYGKKVNWSAPKAIKMATADAHPAIREKIVALVRRVFNVEPTIENGDGALKNVALHSRMVIEHLIANGLLKAKSADVRVPELIFRSPSSVQAAFIAGYFDADGCYRGRKGGYGMDSISHEMLLDVQQLLALNGIVSRLTMTDRSELGWQNIYRLSVTGARFKERFAAFVPTLKRGDNGAREENTYPIAAYEALGVRSKYRQRIHDGVSDRISFGQLERIGARLTADGQHVQAQAIDDLMNVMPDTIASIHPLGDSEVFDFEVEDVHLLSGAGVYTSNSRRGALMLILNDWHPDVYDFINSKREAGKITNANISVGVSDKFMDAVKSDGDWDLVFPDTSAPDYDAKWDGNLDQWVADGGPVLHYSTVKARDLWDKLIESAWASAEPGVFFRERYDKMSNSYYFAPIICTNPCGEQGLPAFGVCNLGAINLSKFYDVENNDVDWHTLDKAVRYATRFLDNVIDATPYFFDENKEQQLGERRVGLNNMGLAELMIRLGIRYGSDESLKFIDKLYAFITRATYETSVELAQERGAFPKFDAEKFVQSGFMQSMPADIREKVRRNGIRNVTLLTQAPNGTIGTMVNTSTGIEPFFSWKYYRKSRLGMHEENALIAQEWFDANPGATELPDHFVTAMELTPEEHVRVQAAIQRWVDSSISKTANVPNSYTVEQTRELYEYMYELGCKGGTIYRDGSRSEQVLTLKEEEKKEEAAPAAIVDGATPYRVYPRPNKLQGVTVTANTPYGTAYITLNSDTNGYPFEVFIVAPGKAGSDLQADAEGLGRMISLQLRTTAPENRMQMLKLVIDQLQGIGGSRSVGFGPKRVLSLPDAVSLALLEHYFPEDKAEQLSLFQSQFEISEAPTDSAPPAPIPVAIPATSNGTNGHHPVPNGRKSKAEVFAEAANGKVQGAEMCPSCHTVSLVRAEGCKTCLNCGFSEC